ncbi:MAG TPA: teicoplanin resistance protein VanZ [Desulfobulbaceae bacterium]|nr:teicoplanin resistance protein VanZ [Desulfobulbaceae bacterium]
MTLCPRFLRCIPMMTVMGIIFFLSHQPGTAFQLPLLSGADKFGHAILYALLAGTALYAMAPVPPRRMLQAGLLVVLFCLLYGISDEFHQSFVPGREPSGGDLLADAAGAVAAVALWLRSTADKQLKSA